MHSHSEPCALPFTSVKISHNVISALHTDNNLPGTMSIALGLGEYVGGRLRVDGSKQPLHIRDHALVYDGSKPHSSGSLNGDLWSLVLFTHSAWGQTPHALREQLIELGFPAHQMVQIQWRCPLTTKLLRR